MTHEPFDLDEPRLRARAVAAARGDAPFDLLLTGGAIFDAITGETRLADIGINGPLIASVHGRGSRSDAATRLDVSGKVTIPGLIDTHMHIESSLVTPATYAEAVLPRGVTTIVWDPHEFANVHGLAGVEWALAAVAGLPLRVIVLAPSCVPSAPGLECAGAVFEAAEIEDLLARPGIGGVAEVMNMRGVIRREPVISGIVQAGLASGKPVFGHARGLADADLNAFMAAGITTDHELTSGADLMAKLQAGIGIELRGSHDHLLPEFVDALNELGHLPASLTLCTDDVFPDDLLHGGGLDDVVRRLIAHGMPSSWALRAATFNAAQRLGRRDLGLIAAGRRADLAILDDVATCRAGAVVANGKLVARDGAALAPHMRHPTGSLTASMHCPRFERDDFRLRSHGRKVRLATIDRPRFTRAGETMAKVEDGFVVTPEGATTIAVVHRHGRAAPRPRIGYLREWGRWRGVFATTVSHDSHNLTLFGDDPGDMAIAANALTRAGGGMVVAQGGRILAQLDLNVSGLVTEAPLAEVAAGFAILRDAMDQIVTWQPPLLVFKACFGATLACNAGPHQTDMGIADIERARPLPSPILEIVD